MYYLLIVFVTYFNIILNYLFILLWGKCFFMSMEDFVENIIVDDRRQFQKDNALSGLKVLNNKNITPVIADFTEYSPLHNGHLFCMTEAKRLHPECLFVAVIPGLFERNGRGLPYIMTRHKRAELAISLGADIAVEGPPMGVMGSGQYSLCLSLMFRTLNADFIPRGYISDSPEFKNILEYINDGKGVAPKPYKIVSMEDKEVLLEGKLSNDDYVIVSLSKSLTKIGFDFKDKFIFIPRLKGVSGTKIREYVSEGHVEDLTDMLPDKTIKILKEEISSNHAPLHQHRAERLLLSNVNSYTREELEQLTLMDETTINNILENRPFSTVEEVENCITRGFSTHRIQRILSVLEVGIFKDEVHKYINSYPQTIRILGYKNNEVLNKFQENLKNNLIGDNGKIWH